MMIPLCIVLRIILTWDGNSFKPFIKHQLCEEPKEMTTEETITSDTPLPLPTVNTVDRHPLLKSLWVYRPNDNVLASNEEPLSYLVPPRQAHSVTRLAKSLTFNYDPYFKKAYFEPFERRPKLVTLVGFRRNKIVPKLFVQEPVPSIEEKMEAAEMQSPYYNGDVDIHQLIN